AACTAGLRREAEEDAMETAAVKLAAREGALPFPAGGHALTIQGMTVSYAEKPSVFSVDAAIPSGSMAAIVGPNGAGKSTLIKAALGIVPALSGSVGVFGEPLAKVRARIAYVPQR